MPLTVNHVPSFDKWGVACHFAEPLLHLALDVAFSAGTCGVLSCVLLPWDNLQPLHPILSGRSYFEEQWKKYLAERGISDGISPPKFPPKYGVEERDSFYTSLSYSGWGGSSGHDAPMIAYDALLGAGDSWTELAYRAFFHGGDSDSTAAIAASWWGVIYGFKGVPPSLYAHLEYKDRLERVAKGLYSII